MTMILVNSMSAEVQPIHNDKGWIQITDNIFYRADSVLEERRTQPVWIFNKADEPEPFEDGHGVLIRLQNGRVIEYSCIEDAAADFGATPIHLHIGLREPTTLVSTPTGN